jgi:rhomboid protease GluP
MNRIQPHAPRFFPWGTCGLLAAIAAMFAVELATGRAGNEPALLPLGALPNRSLNGEHWRLVTYSFLHLNWNHILMNSVLLWWTGWIVERRVGAAQMLGVYFAAVLIAGIAIAFQSHHLPREEGASVGASGGIFALLAAALILAYRKDAVATFGHDPRMRIGLWIAMAIALYITFRPGVSVAGHAGGLVTGLLLGLLVRVRPSASLVKAPA